MRIKCLAQGNNILLPGFEPSTSVSKTDILTNRPICSNMLTYKHADVLHIKPSHSRITRSSSFTMPLLNRPAQSKETFGDRSFSFASSTVRNSIPNDVRCAPSLPSFKSRLKTYLLRSVYKDWTLPLINVHMCMFWPCHRFVDGQSRFALMCIKKVKLINHGCLTILMLLYIMP